MSGTGLRENQVTQQTVKVGVVAIPAEPQSKPDELDGMLARNRVCLNSILENTPWNVKSLH